MPDTSAWVEPDYEEQPERKKKGFPVLLVVGILVGGVVLLFLVCAGVGIWFFQHVMTTDIPAAQASADAFLDDLKCNQIAAAFARTTSSFQGKMTEAQLKALVKAFPDFQNQTGRTLDFRRVFKGTNGSLVTFAVQLHGGGSTTSCTITLVLDDGEWKINLLSVP